MRFIKNGPDIPVQLIQALEEERLVIFCGAGVSMKAGLPNFKGLVCQLKKKLGASFDSIEQQEFDKKNYDRVIGLLEREERFGAKIVRKYVREILATPSNPDLSTHDAILKLSTLSNGSKRLITTNFDLLFEQVDNDLKVASAPTLPPPKPKKWNSLVHLHGKFDKHDPLCKHLVLTSSDFGTAYLLERWASVFISELFNHYTVLFIGYGLNDPVMRYLVDALSIERSIDQRIKKAYALVEYKSKENRDSIREEWKAKNIIPILYHNDDNQHEKLHKSLIRWSKIFEGGATSKREIVKKVAPNEPDSLSIEQVDQLCWAIFQSDTPSYARQFADIKPTPPISWLDTFEKRDLLSELVSPEQNFSLAGYYSRTKSPPSLNDKEIAIGRWLSQHLENKRLIDWVVEQGGNLHPQFEDYIRRRLQSDGSEIKEPYKKAWSTLTSGYLFSSQNQFVNPYHLKKIEWTKATRLKLLEFLKPQISVRKYINWGVGENKETSDAIESTKELIRAEISLKIGNTAQSVFDDLRQRDDWSTILSDIVFTVIQYLREAYDLLEIAGVVTEEYDQSHIHQPSIEPHEQNNHFQDQTFLIEFIREAIDQHEEDANKVKSIIEVLLSHPYPIFKRISLYAVNKIKAYYKVYDLILDKPDAWLWRYSVRKEIYEYLPNLWDEINFIERSNLFDVIRKGPSRELFIDDLKDEELEEAVDRNVWNLLVRINYHSATGLNKKQRNLLNQIKGRRPNFSYRGTEREDFLFWSESGSRSYQTDYSIDDLKSQSLNERVDTLLDHEDHRRGLIENWRTFCSQYPSEANETLNHILRKKRFDEDVFSTAFHGLNLDVISSSDILDLLLSLSREQASLIIRSSSKLLQSISEEYDVVPTDKFYTLWDRLYPFAVKGSSSLSDSDRINQAINHPAGYLVFALIIVTNQYNLKKGDGFPVEIKERLMRVISSEQGSDNLGQVILGRYLPFLNSIDPKWSQNELIPLFDLSDREQSINLWQGYLWNPSINIELWEYIKPYFIKTFDYLDKLEGGSKNLAQILALVNTMDEYDISSKVIRKSLKKLTDEDRAEFFRWFELYLDNTDKEDEKAKIWRQVLIPLFNTTWPKERKYKSEIVANKIATVLLKSEDAFPEAVKVCKPYLVPRSERFYHPHELLETDLIERFPEAALIFINKSTPENPPQWFAPIHKVLHRIEQTNEKLKDREEFKRLQKIIIENNLDWLE